MIETNNKMSVTYGLSKNIESSVKARDIGFSSQYDNKYMIPIEYVARDYDRKSLNHRWCKCRKHSRL